MQKLEITFTQSTGDKVDGRTLIEEFSDDPTAHAIKTQVFSEELTQAVARTTKRLTDMAIEMNSKKGKRK